jgi:hypothetical protein
LLLILLEALANLCKIEAEEVVGFESSADDVLLYLIGTSHHVAILAFSRTHAVLVRSVLEGTPETSGSILRRQD